MGPPPEPASTPPFPSPRPGTSALSWLCEPAPALPELLSAAELGPVTWQALIIDKIAWYVWGEVAIPADRAETPGARATATRPLVPPRAVVGRAAAVWVHTGGPRPVRIDVLVAANGRRPDPHPQRVPHECALPAADVVGVGPLRVTSVERTAVDVARWLAAEAAGPLLERLTVRAGLEPARALKLLDALPGHRGNRAARSTLDALAESRATVGLSPASPGSRRARRPRGTR